MLMNQCLMGEYEKIVLAFKTIAIAVTRPQDRQRVAGLGTPKHFSESWSKRINPERHISGFPLLDPQ